jgi:hypothetical protein
VAPMHRRDGQPRDLTSIMRRVLNEMNLFNITSSKILWILMGLAASKIPWILSPDLAEQSPQSFEAKRRCSGVLYRWCF